MDQASNTPDQVGGEQSVAQLRARVNELERALNNQTTFFNLALNLLCTATLDTGHFQLLNPIWETITGYALEELRAQPFVYFVHPDDLQSTRNAIAELQQGQEIIAFTNRYRCKDGSYRWLEWRGTPVLEQGLIYAAARDITEQRETEDELRRQNELLMRQAQTLREVATPLIPLADDVIVMPLIGHIDTVRSRQIMEVLLEGVANHQAGIVIIDITGVEVVDTQIANTLLQTARAANLLGAEVILTGIQPQIAQTLIALGVDLSALITRSTLQEGIRYAAQVGAQIVPPVE